LYNTYGSYSDAPTEGVRRVLEWFTGEKIPRSQAIDTSQIEYLRMGTTVATNALLERKGERCALLIVSLRPRFCAKLIADERAC
jgi:5-oxoprolinase (ATP-hydrolysing)